MTTFRWNSFREVKTVVQGHTAVAAAAAESLQSCPTLCDPLDGSPPGSAIPGILQARTLDWVAFSFSNAWKWKVKVKLLSHVRLFATRWTAAYQALLSMGFSRQEYWSGVTLPSPTTEHSHDELLAVSSTHQWLPISQKERKLDVIYILLVVHKST